MKRQEFEALIQKFGFTDITKNEIIGYYKRLQEEDETVATLKKYKYKQCYITFEEDYFQITFNNPPYSLATNDINFSQVMSLFYYLSIVSNKKFAVKRDNPDICGIYDKLEELSKTIDNMQYVDKKRYSLDMIEFNKVRKFILG